MWAPRAGGKWRSLYVFYAILVAPRLVAAVDKQVKEELHFPSEKEMEDHEQHEKLYPDFEQEEDIKISKHIKEDAAVREHVKQQKQVYNPGHTQQMQVPTTPLPPLPPSTLHLLLPQQPETLLYTQVQQPHLTPDPMQVPQQQHPILQQEEYRDPTRAPSSRVEAPAIPAEMGGRDLPSPPTLRLGLSHQQQNTLLHLPTTVRTPLPLHALQRQ